MSIGYSDAPVPTSPQADFANWRKYVDEQLDRLSRTKHSRFVIATSGTTDSVGLLTFTHDAGEIPQGVFITITSPTPSDVWCSFVDSYTEETARARFFETSAGSVIAYASQTVTFKAYVIV